MMGSPNRLGLGHPLYRQRARRAFSWTTTVAFSGVAFFVLVLFCAGHNSIVRMHGAMQSPTVEQPAGWATLHRTTTVQSATVTISGSAITGSALTATTTETSAQGAGSSSQHSAATAAAAELPAAAAHAAAAHAAAAPASSSMKGSLIHMLGDLQHSLHAMLAAHTGWKPGDKITRAQLAAAAAASMPDEGRDIELSAQKVAQVVGGAKAAQQLQKLSQQAAGATAADMGEDITYAEAYAGLYGHGGGTVVFAPHDDLATCPEGTAAPHSAQAAVVLLAGSSAAALKRSLDGLMLLHSRAGPDVRAAFHLFVGLDSDDAAVRQLAASYAYDSLGAVKLVHHSSSSSKHISANKLYDVQEELKGAAAPAPAATGAKPGASGSSSSSSHAHEVGAAALQQGRLAVARALLAVEFPSSAANPNNSKKTSSTASSSSANSSTASASSNSTSSKAATPKALSKGSNTATVHAAAPRDSASNGGSSSSSSGRSSSSSSSSFTEHVRLMLHVFFNCFKYPAVLLLEDDVKLAPDFFDFYAATQWLMVSDSSLYCLSAWNPVGHKQQQVHPKRLLRSDCHPGKGWLLSRELGLQLLAAWPQGKFDWQQYVRSSAVRAGRQCLVPEMPRMVPADPHEMSDGAHIHDPAMDGKKKITTDHIPAPVMTGGATRGSDAAAAAAAPDSSTGAVKAAAAASDEEGMFDVEAYTEYNESDDLLDLTDPSGAEWEGAGEVEPAAAAAAAAGGVGAADAGSSSGLGSQSSQTAGRQQRQSGSWMHQDLSLLLADNYQLYMQQLLQAARPCDVAAASVLADPRSACLVAYNSAAYLTTTAHRLGLPVEVVQGMPYCYPLPSAPGAITQQHCQDYMPEMAYNGIVSGYNLHGARIYLLHAKYIEALHKGQGTTAATATPAAAATATAESTAVAGANFA